MLVPLRTGTGLSVCGPEFVHFLNADDQRIDARDFIASDFLKDSDPVSGLGGWGDPVKDYQVQDGGFSSLSVSYPSQHIVRRNFTEYPYAAIDELFGGTGGGLFPDPDTPANSTFTIEKVAAAVNGYAGDFAHFQQWMERGEGPHAAVHFILGG